MFASFGICTGIEATPRRSPQDPSFFIHREEGEDARSHFKSSVHLSQGLPQAGAVSFPGLSYLEQPIPVLNSGYNSNPRPVEQSGASVLPPSGIETTKDKGIAFDELFDGTIGYVNSLGVVLTEYLCCDHVPQTNTHRLHCWSKSRATVVILSPGRVQWSDHSYIASA
jgi:hypothetical protein